MRNDMNNVPEPTRPVKHDALTPLLCGSRFPTEPPSLDEALNYLTSIHSIVREGLLSPDPLVTVAAVELIGRQAEIVDELLGRQPRRRWRTAA